MLSKALTLSDHHRTVLLHIIEVVPEQFTWQLVMEEHCGCADADCTVEAQTVYPTRAQAEAAAWAAGNALLQGTRTAGESSSA